MAAINLFVKPIYSREATFFFVGIGILKDFDTNFVHMAIKPTHGITIFLYFRPSIIHLVNSLRKLELNFAVDRHIIC